MREARLGEGGAERMVCVTDDLECVQAINTNKVGARWGRDATGRMCMCIRRRVARRWGEGRWQASAIFKETERERKGSRGVEKGSGLGCARCEQDREEGRAER